MRDTNRRLRGVGPADVLTLQNEITRKDSYPMPLVGDTLAKLAGSRIFSGVDMHGAFHVVDIAKEDREKTAFATPFGSFQQRKLGFGVCNGPATYCRLVEKVLRGIPPQVAVGFLDDGVIHSVDLETHFKNLAITLNAYRKAGLKLSPDKCSFFRPEILYLGHVLNHEGIRPPDSYKDAVAKWELPQYKTEVRAFLGVVGYYRDHIPNYAALSRPWTQVTGVTDKAAEKLKLTITPEMRASFQALKQALVSAPILGLPRFRGPQAGPFILDTDYSKVQIAGVLSQVQDPKKPPVVIAYGSKLTDKHQQNYPSTKGELFAGYYWMQKYRYYLAYGPQFKWRTDNAALQYNLNLKTPSMAVTNWRNCLADFNFSVEHRAGTKHANADGLSRGGHPEPAGDEFARINLLHAIPGTENTPSIFDHEKDEILDYQREDSDLKLVRDWIATNTKPNALEMKGLSRIGKIYAGLLDRLSVDRKDRLLRYQPTQPPWEVRRRVVCLPRRLWDDVIETAHTMGGHMGIHSTVDRLRQVVYFPSMALEVQQFVEACKPCQKKKKQKPDQRHTLRSVVTGYPFQRVHLDFVGPLQKGLRTGAKYLLTLRDSFSRWSEAYPVKTTTAEEALSVLEKEFFSRFGVPEVIHTDCDPAFTSRLFKDAARKMEIQLTDTGGYNPKGNACVERMHRDLGEILRAFLEDNPESWEDILPWALYAMRNHPCRSTGMTPYQVLFGRNISTPLGTLFGDPNPPEDPKANFQEWTRDLRKRIDRAQEFIRERAPEMIKRQRRQYNQQRRFILPGAKVWLCTPITKRGVPKKLTSYWTGPWIVSQAPDLTAPDVMVRIRPDPEWDATKAEQTVTIDRVKPFHDNASGRAPTGAEDFSMEGDEFAELNLQPQGPPGPGPGGPPGGGPGPGPPGPPGHPGGGGAPPQGPAEEDEDNDDQPQPGPAAAPVAAAPPLPAAGNEAGQAAAPAQGGPIQPVPPVAEAVGPPGDQVPEAVVPPQGPAPAEVGEAQAPGGPPVAPEVPQGAQRFSPGTPRRVLRTPGKRKLPAKYQGFKAKIPRSIMPGRRGADAASSSTTSTSSDEEFRTPQGGHGDGSGYNRDPDYRPRRGGGRGGAGIVR